MKKFLYTAFLFLIFFSVKSQTSGGPDLYGYTWKNSNDSSSIAPVYHWLDIDTMSNVQVVNGLSDDNSAGWFSLGWDFRYYWGDFDKVKIGSNGWISFDNTANIAHGFPDIPTAGGVAGDNYLAPYLSDLMHDGPGNNAVVKYWTNYKDSFLVSYINVPYWIQNNPGYFGDNSFQLLLNGTDTTITFNYKRTGMFPANTGFNDLIVGIENIIGNMGFELYQDIVPDSSFSIKFYYPDTVTYEVTDYSILYNQNNQNGAIVKKTGDTILLSSVVKNTGNQDVTNNVTLTMRVLNPAGLVVYQENAIISPLDVNDSLLINYPIPFIANTAGTHTIESSFSLAADQNPGNNLLQTELVVVDPYSSVITVGYGNGAATGSLQWAGGFAGAGIYIEPPYYPFLLTGLEYEIAFATDTNGFYAIVYDDDGVNGSAGTALVDTFIAGNTITINTYRQIILPQPVIISSGAIYVTWMMEGSVGSIALSSNPPISNRTYEILSLAWSEYRERSVNDFKINILSEGTCDINPIITASGPLDFCLGQSLTLSAPPGLMQYSWNNGANTQSIDINSSGNYFCTVLSSGNCMDVSDTVTVNVTDPTPSVSLSGTTLTCSSALDYQWYFNGAIIVGATSQSYTFTETGAYSVIVTDPSGCIGTSANYFVQVGIEEITIQNFNAYPNPVTDLLMIDLVLLSNKEIHIEITNAIGEIIYASDEKVSGQKFQSTVDMKSFASGVYLLSVQSGSQKISKMIMKN